MTTSPIKFMSTAPDTPVKSDKPLGMFNRAPTDPIEYLPAEARVRLSLLKAAKLNAEQAMDTAVDVGLPAEFMGELQAQRGASAANLRAAQSYLDTLRKPVEAAQTANIKGKTLDGIRKAIADTEARMVELQLMKPTRDEQIAKLKTLVNGAAANAAPDISRLAHEHSNVADPALAFRQLFSSPKSDAFALLALISGDAIIDKLSEAIPADDGALPALARQEAIDECRVELLRLGHAEEALIRASANPPLRRPTALAECLLGVK